MKQAIYDALVGKDLGSGTVTPDDARHHATWHAASGHPGGWRVVRGYSPLEQLLDKRGNPILFASRIAASKRADVLEAAEEAAKSLRTVDRGSYRVTKAQYRRVACVGKRVIWVSVVDGVLCPPYVVGFCRNRQKFLLEEFASLARATAWAKDNQP